MCVAILFEVKPFKTREMPKIKSQKHGKSSASSSAVGGGAVDDGSRTVRTLLAPNTNIGQHFLKNPAIVDSIVAKAGIRSTDTTLEVGPGTGNLTVRLLEHSKKVVAVEFDRRMIREVLKRVEGTENEKHLEVIHGDVLKVELPYFGTAAQN